ncbi:1-phosphatidylinositol phosphodiesterase [Pseudomonas migulae]|uniref:phospholipase n=1 Tax=Pseudomonas migulae TaxID=78543 RepID=UPI00209D8E1D|nr:phospholipase [Pseudomonas migulae]MCP1496033.1 1-phosphatidylinositol phosphodiesterase [Pseudomonas migulae]
MKHALNNPYITRNFNPNNWMSDIPIIDSLSLAELVLPGAHNAGVDKKASYTALGISHWAACQNNSFYYQLTHGARALDLRLEYAVGGDGVGTFWFQHNGFRSSRSLESLIMSVIRFLDENPDEFIILDFHQLNPGNQRFDYKEFNRLLLTHLGNRLIPSTHVFLTLGQLKQASHARRVMVAAENHTELDSTYFCEYIEHEWSGIGTASVSELNVHITKVMKFPPGGSLPWSLSATSYNVAEGPVNIREHLDRWFDPALSDWVLNSNIINADFFETSNLVRHCRTANLIKANNH